MKNEGKCKKDQNKLEIKTSFSIAITGKKTKEREIKWEKQNNILCEKNLRDSAATFHLITSNLGDSPTELRGPASPLSMPLIPPFSRVI